MDEQEPWAHRRDEPYLFPKAGEGAREQERRASQGKSGFQRFAERLLDVRNEERNWRRGAQGEEEVARRLAKLPAEWSIVHDLTIGLRGANLDHLVVGPPGVFTLNTKNLSGRVTVYQHALLVNGQKTDYLPKAVAEARRVSSALSAVAGASVVAQPLIVVLAPELTIKQQPADVQVIARRWVPRWFLRLDAQHLRPSDVARLERLARTPSTWKTGGQQPNLTRSIVEGAAPASTQDAVSIKEWKRYGKHRLYVRDADGTTLGWMDATSGTVTIDDETRRDDVMTALQRHARREWR